MAQAWGAFSLSSTLFLNMYFLINIHPSLFSTEFSILTSQLQLLGSYNLSIKPHPAASWLLPVLLLKEIVLLPKWIYEDRSESIKQIKLIKLTFLSNFSVLKSRSALGTLASVLWFYVDRSVFWALGNCCTSDMLKSTKGNKFTFSWWGTGLQTKLDNSAHNFRGSLLYMF